VTSVSRPILEDFRELSQRTDLVLEEVRNGYDFDLPESPKPAGDRFVIAYTGTFYGSYTPYPFFRALERFFAVRAADDVSVRIVGSQKPVDLPQAIRSRVSFEAAVPHDQALDIMRRSDLLLLYHPKTERKGYYSGKLFEYLASLRPVLAVVDPAGVAAELVRDAGAGYVADCGDPDAIARAIDDAYLDWKGRTVFAPNREVIARHHRREQARILQDLMLGMIAGRPPGSAAGTGTR
jgi:glycosyltransferase involved in cell wall biosynthesis